jgi:hypothetical protein
LVADRCQMMCLDSFWTGYYEFGHSIHSNHLLGLERI